MPLGAGFAPAGSSPAGYGVPDAAHVPLSGVYPDALTGLPQPGPLINPVTKSYEYTADGRTVGVGRAQQLVQLAVTTLRGSAVLSNLGLATSQFQEKGTNFQQQVLRAVQDAFAPISTNPNAIVTLVSVDVQDYPNIPDRSTALIKWRDNTTGTESTTTVPLS